MANIPNPAIDRTTLFYTLRKEDSKGEIRITDISGRIVDKFLVTSESSSIEIDCSNYSSGIYFNSLVVKEQVVSTVKIAITR